MSKIFSKFAVHEIGVQFNVSSVIDFFRFSCSLSVCYRENGFVCLIKESAARGDHIWINTNTSGDLCHLSESPECSKTGPRKRCSSCRMVAHTSCIHSLDKSGMRCKPTFCEGCPKTYRQNIIMRHHWLHRRREDRKCHKCSKSFSPRFSFQSKEIVAISCSWCKIAYHLQCFPQESLEEECFMGALANIIVPPYWIIKLAKKGSFKSSVRKRRKSIKKRESKDDHGRTFVIKPIPSSHVKPIVVFINPKSGGNQGVEILQKFQWLLNPRQVFDLGISGPRLGLELYKKVPNLRILACGGDGTVGWILSHIDSLGISPHPPVAILPLGTGNDLARTLNWGGSYSDEPLVKVLIAVEEGPVVQLDRWNIEVTNSVDSSSSLEDGGVPNLPLDVMNNYFSLGADAHVTLEFHESREANPAKFSSRFRNKMFYAGVGGKDLLRRSWRDLSEHIQLECDGQDFTFKIKDTKFHCLLFLNIPKYAAGTTPWGNPSQTTFEPQRLDDGFLEVIGFTAASLAGLQIGAHGGMRLTQCQSVRLRTTKIIPMQVDGEPCRLLPSIIHIHLRNQANMIQKSKRSTNTISPLNDQLSQHSVVEQLHLKVHWLQLTAYESFHYSRNDLHDASSLLGIIVVDSDSLLEHVRMQIERLRQDALATGQVNCPSCYWCFVDSITADHFFQMNQTQEQFYYIMDIASDVVYILDLEGCSQNGQSSSSSSISSATASASLCSYPKGSMSDPATDSLFQPVWNDDKAKYSLSPRNIDLNRLDESQIKSLRGKSAMFMKACWKGNLEQAVEAHNLGIDLLTVDKSGMTGLHYAVLNNHQDIVRYLIEKAPNVMLDMTDSEKGQTALHKAASLQLRNICRMLVKAGSSLYIADVQGNTACQLAFMTGDQELGAYLQCEQYSRPPCLPKVHETEI